CVGMVDRSRMFGAGRVREGSMLIGLASSGVHCNGFSLVRHALAGWSDERLNEARSDLFGRSLIAALLEPTLCYSNEMRSLCEGELALAAAHISGGGLIDNLPRVIPDGLCA